MSAADVTTGGLVATPAPAAADGGPLAAVAGGLAGVRSHRRVDEAGLDQPPTH